MTGGQNDNGCYAKLPAEAPRATNGGYTKTETTTVDEDVERWRAMGAEYQERKKASMKTPENVTHQDPPATRQCPPTHHTDGKATLTKDATGQSNREEVKRQTGTLTHGGITAKDVGGNQNNLKRTERTNNQLHYLRKLIMHIHKLILEYF